MNTTDKGDSRATFDELKKLLSSLLKLKELAPIAPAVLTALAMLPKLLETVKEAITAEQQVEQSDTTEAPFSPLLSHEMIDRAVARVVEAMFNDNSFSRWLTQAQAALQTLATHQEAQETLRRFADQLFALTDRAIARLIDAALDEESQDLLNHWRVLESLFHRGSHFILEHLINSTQNISSQNTDTPRPHGVPSSTTPEAR